MNILEELYHGNIHPKIGSHEKNPYFDELLGLCQRNRENLLKTLDESEKETFEKFNDAQAEMEDIAQYQKFIYGFRLGALLMAETFTGKDELVSSDM